MRKSYLESLRPPLPNGGGCQKCINHRGEPTQMLYHDYDPRHRHNGYTCGACGTEQTLANGTVSMITTNRGKVHGS